MALITQSARKTPRSSVEPHLVRSACADRLFTRAWYANRAGPSINTQRPMVDRRLTGWWREGTMDVRIYTHTHTHATQPVIRLIPQFSSVHAQGTRTQSTTGDVQAISSSFSFHSSILFLSVDSFHAIGRQHNKLNPFDSIVRLARFDRIVSFNATTSLTSSNVDRRKCCGLRSTVFRTKRHCFRYCGYVVGGSNVRPPT